MKLLKAAFSFSLMLLLSGCIVKSLNKFYTSESRINLPEICGTWKLVPKESEKKKEQNIKWNFQENTILTTDENGIQSPLDAVYFKVGNNIFVDLYPGKLDDKNKTVNGYWMSCVEPVHTLCKVVLVEDSLKLIIPNVQKIKSACSEGRANLKFVDRENLNEIEIFISSADEWIKFLTEFGDDSEIFKEDSALYFSREKTKQEGEQKE